MSAVGHNSTAGLHKPDGYSVLEHPCKQNCGILKGQLHVPQTTLFSTRKTVLWVGLELGGCNPASHTGPPHKGKTALSLAQHGRQMQVTQEPAGDCAQRQQLYQHNGLDDEKAPKYLPQDSQAT